MNSRNNVIILAAIVLAIGSFYAVQQLTGSTSIAIGVGLVVGVILPTILTNFLSGSELG